MTKAKGKENSQAKQALPIPMLLGRTSSMLLALGVIKTSVSMLSPGCYKFYPLMFSATFHPPTYGQAKRTIQTLEDLFRACVIELKGNWDNHLS